MSISTMDRRSFIGGTALAGAVAASGIALTRNAIAEEPVPASGEATATEYEFSFPGFEKPAPYSGEDKKADPESSEVLEPPASRLAGKVALVTGASSGIGREIARAFAREGAKVVAVARRMDRLQALSEESPLYEGEIVAYKADLSDLGQIPQVVDFALDTFGRIDVLVNNAAVIGAFTRAESQDLGLLQYMQTLNVAAPMAFMKYVIPTMVEQGGGSVINIGSVCGAQPNVGSGDYTATKHALHGLSRHTAFMYAPEHVRVNLLCPGGTDTECTLVIPLTDEVCYERAGNISLAMSHSYPGPEVIAATAIHLASDASRNINGATIMSDDAMTCR